MDSRGGGGEATAGQQKTRRRRKNTRNRGKRNTEGMTKNGRRNRRKSCSSAETGANAESGAKDTTHGVKEKGSTGGHMPAVPAEATKSTSGDSIRGWFSSLSWEDRAAVSSIEDTAFVATLLDLASSSSHQSTITSRAKLGGT